MSSIRKRTSTKEDNNSTSPKPSKEKSSSKKDSNLPLLKEVDSETETEPSEDDRGIPREHPFYKKTDAQIKEIQERRMELEIKKMQQDEKILSIIALVLSIIAIFIGILVTKKINIFNNLKKPFSCDLWKRYSLPYTYSLSEYDKHVKFCHNYGKIYPNECECKALNQPKYHEIKQIPKNYKKLAPILIITSCRPKYLYRTLSSLETVYYAYDHDIIVSTDCEDETILEEINAVVSIFQYKSYKRLFYVKLYNQKHIKNCKNKITHHYHLAIDYLLNIVFPKAIYFIVFEDDLRFGSDVLHYFYAHKDLLFKENPENDNSAKPTVWSISAWNDHGYLHSSENPKQVYRVDGFPGLGWMARADIFRNELLPKWPLHKESDWDMWLRTDSTRESRVSIIPDISRTFHFGETGVNMNPNWHDAYYLRKKLYNHNNPKKLIDWHSEGNPPGISRLSKQIYEEELTNQIKNSLKMVEYDICHEENFMNPVDSTRSYVIKVSEQTSKKDALKYLKCLKLWDLDFRGLYQGVLRIYYKKVPLIVVFCNVNVRFCAF